MRVCILLIFAAILTAAQYKNQLLDFKQYPATLEFDDGQLLYGKALFQQKRKVTFRNEDTTATLLIIRSDCIKPGSDADLEPCWPRLKVDIEIDGKQSKKSALLRIHPEVTGR